MSTRSGNQRPFLMTPGQKLAGQIPFLGVLHELNHPSNPSLHCFQSRIVFHLVLLVMYSDLIEDYQICLMNGKPPCEVDLARKKKDKYIPADF